MDFDVTVISQLHLALFMFQEAVYINYQDFPNFGQNLKGVSGTSHFETTTNQTSLDVRARQSYPICCTVCCERSFSWLV